METSNWYEALYKPGWAPPLWVFGVVWSILYPIIVSVCFIPYLVWVITATALQTYIAVNNR
ncbi:tryptophan-rich sensory protein [Candidatus Saccharibacteria bacterium]|nr:tryptophan-rich sensory protein [Candidatus Saccharibacteria bacterium]